MREITDVRRRRPDVGAGAGRAGADLEPVGEEGCPGLAVRVQNVISLRSAIVTTGVSSQLLIVPVADVLLKFAPMYDVGSPECDGNATVVALEPVGHAERFAVVDHRPVGQVRDVVEPLADCAGSARRPNPRAEADEADDLAPLGRAGDTRLLAAPAPVAATSITARAITAGNASSNANASSIAPSLSPSSQGRDYRARAHFLITFPPGKQSPFRA